MSLETRPVVADTSFMESVAPISTYEARLSAIIESSFDAIIAKDLNSVITDWNPAAERLFGYTRAEAVGRSITMLIPDGLKDEEEAIIRRIRAGERVESFETTRIRKDGTRISVSLTISPIRGANGVVIGASKIARDITAAKESEHRIRMLLREINHRVKNQYAVIISLIRETGLRSKSIDEFQAKVRERITALAASHDLLVKSEWSGSTLAELVAEQLAPFGHEALVTVTGPLISIVPNAVQNLGMAFHELGTNSAKYGVLSGRPGQITVSWNAGPSPDTYSISWEERFEEALPDAPSSPGGGFGSIVLTRVAPTALRGTAKLTRTDQSVRWELEAAVEALFNDEADIP